MIATLALWFVIAVPALGFGLFVLNAIDQFGIVDRLGDRVLMAVWLGLMTLSLALLSVSLVGPVTVLGFVFVAAAMLFVSLRSREVRVALWDVARAGLRDRVGVVLVVVAILIAAYVTRPVTGYDSGLYHYQLVRWLSDYGLVRGLALIHERFGFVTSWFSLPAVFDRGILLGRTAAFLGGAVFFLAAAQWLVAVSRWLKDMARPADHFSVFGFGFLLIFMCKLELIFTPAPDVPMLVLPVLVAWCYWATGGNKLPQLPLLLALGAFAIKLSAAPILAVTTMLGAYGLVSVRPARAAEWLLPVCAGLISVAILIVASVIVSGCGMYPVAFTCVDLPWSIGHEAASTSTKVITEWARWGKVTPGDANSINWLPYWVRHHKGFAEMLIVFGAALWIVRRRLGQTSEVLPGLLLAAVGIAYALIAAPDPRFWAGYLFILPGLWFAAVPWLKTVPGPRNERQFRFRRMGPGLLSGIMAAAMFAGFSQEKPLKSSDLGNMLDQWLLPPPMRQPDGLVVATTGPQGGVNRSAAAEVTGGYVRYSYPVSGDQCWAATLPCAPGVLGHPVRYLDPSRQLAGGFVVTTEAAFDNANR